MNEGSFWNCFFLFNLQKLVSYLNKIKKWRVNWINMLLNDEIIHNVMIGLYMPHMLDILLILMKGLKNEMFESHVFN
jgi:hypothetical protein